MFTLGIYFSKATEKQAPSFLRPYNFELSGSLKFIEINLKYNWGQMLVMCQMKETSSICSHFDSQVSSKQHWTTDAQYITEKKAQLFRARNNYSAVWEVEFTFVKTAVGYDLFYFWKNWKYRGNWGMKLRD